MIMHVLNSTIDMFNREVDLGSLGLDGNVGGGHHRGRRIGIGFTVGWIDRMSLSFSILGLHCLGGGRDVRLVQINGVNGSSRGGSGFPPFGCCHAERKKTRSKDRRGAGDEGGSRTMTMPTVGAQDKP